MTSRPNTTKIDFVAGFDPVCPVPKAVQSASLGCRIAVIQHTCRADTVDMFFDRLLWDRLLAFALCFGQNLSVTIGQRGLKNEVELDAFLAAWRELKESDREPPEFIFVRDGRELVLCIATEYWVHVGGPAPYADSYTYSLFSKDDISKIVIKFLAEAKQSQGWEIATKV